MAADPFAGLEPRELWAHFSEFTRIARPPGQEAGMAKYVCAFAEKHGFHAVQDAAGNVRVRVPATPGREGKAPVILQGHLDMVCTRDADAGEYDPAAGTIRVFRAKEQGNDVVEAPDGEWLKAFRTSLGADNGVGVAAALTAAVDPKVLHGPLDLLFTVEEEAGLVGASKLDPAIVQGKRLLNLDSEDEGVFTIGSAGGRNIDLLWARAPLPAAGVVARVVTVAGLLGGHSGVDINRGRLNAIRALARVLQEAASQVTLRLASLVGGDRSNAIPREAKAVCVLAGQDAQTLTDAVGRAATGIKAQYEGIEDGVAITVTTPAQPPVAAFTPSQSQALLDLLRSVPTGVVAMSQSLPRLVETSNNLGVATTTEQGVLLTCSARSSVAPALDDVTATVVSVAGLAGARVVPGPSYPGWNPDPAAPTLGALKAAYRRLYSKDAEVAAVHAGLECGVLNSKIPGIDMVSFGPTIVGAHSTRERVNIETVGKFYGLLAAVLGDLSS